MSTESAMQRVERDAAELEARMASLIPSKPPMPRQRGAHQKGPPPGPEKRPLKDKKR